MRLFFLKKITAIGVDGDLWALGDDDASIFHWHWGVETTDDDSGSNSGASSNGGGDDADELNGGIIGAWQRLPGAAAFIR
jgi:hypothetical protein